jgi:L-asparaginase / beta-aspartyl-peptidase
VNRVYVHGGVSARRRAPRRSAPRSRQERQERAASLSHALRVAIEAGTALDAAEEAVRALEDDPVLNAGTGSVLNLRGEIELDAGIADGSSGRFAGVANVRVRNPVSLARKVMEETPHVLVTGTGAAALAAGMEELDGPTPEQQRRWAKARAAGTLRLERFGDPDHVDTVGAVALDRHGNLAAASSTGGVFGKLPGRVGDSPVFGAGIYATRRAAVVGTGVGELFLETLASLRVAELIVNGTHPQGACEEVIARLGERRPGWAAGLLALDSGGRTGAAYRGGSWALAGPDGPLAAALLH